MSQEVWKLRALVEAIDHLETLKLFQMNVQGCEMFLTWSNGSALGGYKEIAKAISEIVSEGWFVMKQEAIRRAEARVTEAREALRQQLSEEC